MCEPPGVVSAEVSGAGGVQTDAATHAGCMCLQTSTVQILQAGM